MTQDLQFDYYHRLFSGINLEFLFKYFPTLSCQIVLDRPGGRQHDLWMKLVRWCIWFRFCNLDRLHPFLNAQLDFSRKLFRMEMSWTPHGAPSTYRRMWKGLRILRLKNKEQAPNFLIYRFLLSLAEAYHFKSKLLMQVFTNNSIRPNPRESYPIWWHIS